MWGDKAGQSEFSYKTSYVLKIYIKKSFAAKKRLILVCSDIRAAKESLCVLADTKRVIVVKYNAL
jgi:hypothetical protein